MGRVAKKRKKLKTHDLFNLGTEEVHNDDPGAARKKRKKKEKKRKREKDSKRSDWAIALIIIRANFLAANSNASRWRVALPPNQSCSWRMNQPAILIRKPATRLSIYCFPSPKNIRRRCC